MIALEVAVAKSFYEKSVGLLGTKVSKPLLIKTRFGIHTFGMHYPIDVVVLDNKNSVVELKKNLLPNRVFFWNPKYDTVLELPPRTIQEKQITLTSHISLDLAEK